LTLCANVCPFHFSKGIPKALTSIIVVNYLILIIDLTFQERLFLPKNLFKEWEFNGMVQNV
jgi:hypothetical protein